jgi:hypothetical protein
VELIDVGLAECRALLWKLNEGQPMSTESHLREKLRKIEALFAGGGTTGEESRYRSPHPRPPPAGLGRHAGARAAVLLVPQVGTDAEAARTVRPAASRR